MTTFPYKAKCPKCGALVPVRGYKYKGFKPVFAAHHKGLKQASGFCWMSGMPVTPEHEQVPQES